MGKKHPDDLDELSESLAVVGAIIALALVFCALAWWLV